MHTCSQPLLLSSSRWAVGGATVSSQASFNAAVQDGAMWSCYHNMLLSKPTQTKNLQTLQWTNVTNTNKQFSHWSTHTLCFHLLRSPLLLRCRGLLLLARRLSYLFLYPFVYSPNLFLVHCLNFSTSLKCENILFFQYFGIFSIFFHSGIFEIPYKNQADGNSAIARFKPNKQHA